MSIILQTDNRLTYFIFNFNYSKFHRKIKGFFEIFNRINSKSQAGERMILVTGDTHGDISRFSDKSIKKLKKGDTLIICGDFGFIWDGSKKEKKTLKKLGKRKYNVLFVEGIHENFDELEKYETEEWNGGLTRKISGNLRQLIRGNVFDLDGKKVFAFGGGTSEENDSYLNLDGVKMLEKWRREIPTESELKKSDEALASCQNTVDFVVSYEPPAQLAEFLSLGKTDRNHINTYLEKIKSEVDFKMWYFGCNHINKTIPPKYKALFNEVATASKGEKNKKKIKGE